MHIPSSVSHCIFESNTKAIAGGHRQKTSKMVTPCLPSGNQIWQWKKSHVNGPFSIAMFDYEG